MQHGLLELSRVRVLSHVLVKRIAQSRRVWLGVEHPNGFRFRSLDGHAG